MVETAIVLMMLWNAVISADWAREALKLALRERWWSWPVPWRVLVANWMVWKAALFVAIEAALVFSVPEWAALAVVVGFTQAHTFAWRRWKTLPEGADREGGTRGTR